VVKSRAGEQEGSCPLRGGEAELTDKEAGEIGQIASSASADQTKPNRLLHTLVTDQLNVNIYFLPYFHTHSLFSGVGTQNKPLTVFHQSFV